MTVRDWWRRFVARHLVAPVDTWTEPVRPVRAPLHSGAVLQRARPAVPYYGTSRCLDCDHRVALSAPWVAGVSRPGRCAVCFGSRRHIVTANGTEYFLTGYQPSTVEHE